MRSDPQLPFRAVVGNRSDNEQHLIDQLGSRGQVEQLAKTLALPVPVLTVAHANAGVNHRSRDRPRPRGMVLDDRNP